MKLRFQFFYFYLINNQQERFEERVVNFKHFILGKILFCLINKKKKGVLNVLLIKFTNPLRFFPFFNFNFFFFLV